MAHQHELEYVYPLFDLCASWNRQISNLYPKLVPEMSKYLEHIYMSTT